jgi:hypothetical protein
MAVDTAQPCPSCQAETEPDQDGDCQFWECGECGYAWGHQVIKRPVQACAAGLPAPQQPDPARRPFARSLPIEPVRRP